MPCLTRRNLLACSLPLLLLLPFAISSADEKPVEKKEEKVQGPARVGTWNIEWLGNAEKRRKPLQEATAIADYITASKVELLGLNEITGNVETDGRVTNSILTEAFKVIKEQKHGDWRHLLFPGKDREQLCGVAWNDAVWKLIDTPFQIPVRRGPRTSVDLWRRHPHAVKFSRGEKLTDIVLIPVHMKSNSGGGVTQQSKTRAEEARTLVRSLAAVQNHFKDDDVVILGDFNCLLRDEPALAHYRTTGYRDLNSTDELTWIKDRLFDPAPFDRILIPEEQPEFRDCPFTVFRTHGFNSEREYREKLSDHYLVYTDIKVMEDDD